MNISKRAIEFIIDEGYSAFIRKDDTVFRNSLFYNAETDTFEVETLSQNTVVESDDVYHIYTFENSQDIANFDSSVDDWDDDNWDELIHEPSVYRKIEEASEEVERLLQIEA